VAETIKVAGLKELEANLKMLGEEMRERGVKLMMSRAAVPMRNEARNRVPVLKEQTHNRNPGTVRKWIHIWRKRKTRYAVTYFVGVRGLPGARVSAFKTATGLASKDNPNDPFYWRFVELGTSKMRPRPFLRPAFEGRRADSVQIALEEGQKFVKRTARRFLRLRTRSALGTDTKR
jgi:HK97 gp10 family phage protein